MDQLKLSIFTQTPAVRFVRDEPDHPLPPLLSSYREGTDYLPSPGGVTRMVQAFLRRARETRRLRAATWYALGSAGPDRVRLARDTVFEQARLARGEQGRYARAKAAVWEAIHGIPGGTQANPRDVAAGLDLLSETMARRAARSPEGSPDACYAHDFQLLPLARHLPSGLPRVFRWHVPVAGLDSALRDYAVRCLNRYDAVIVSTQGYASTLHAWGVEAPIHAAYPYLDERRSRPVVAESVAAFEERHGLAATDTLFLTVARLDPMKRQDLAIRAFARIARRSPGVKLMLLGGGGFSAGRNGLGLPHATAWRDHLLGLARDLGVADRVIFTGGVDDDELDIAYTRARAVLLPSSIEGFGLAAVEGWLYGKPVVVSDGAGVSELVEDGVNGYRFASGDEVALAHHMRRLADDPALARELGDVGRGTAQVCHARVGADDVWTILAEALTCARS